MKSKLLIIISLFSINSFAGGSRVGVASSNIQISAVAGDVRPTYAPGSDIYLSGSTGGGGVLYVIAGTHGGGVVAIIKSIQPNDGHEV